MFVSVNSHIIRANKKHGRNDAPIRVAKSRFDRHPAYAREVQLKGNARVIYEPAGLLSCGARVAIEADDVEIIE